MRGITHRLGTTVALTTATLFTGVVVATPASAMSISAYGRLDKYPFWYQSGTDPLMYYKAECVSYAAQWLLHNKGVKVYKVGNAVQWKSWAKDHHYAVNHTVEVGAVAWWPHKTYGHVAIVLKITKTGVEVGEGNWYHKHGYDRRPIKKGSSSWPKYFLHIKK